MSVPPAIEILEHEVVELVVTRSANGQVVSRTGYKSERHARIALLWWRNKTTEARTARLERVQFRTVVTTTVIS